jgi:zinc protease
MYRWPLHLAAEAAWAGHPYGRALPGHEGSVGQLNAASLKAWHEDAALAARGVLVCVADADPDEMVAVVARRFTGLVERAAPDVAAPAWPTAPAERVDPRDKAQTALALMFPGPSRRDDSRFAATILAGIASGLGGRFFDELRDRQSLAYVVHFAPVVRQLAGAFVGYIGTSPEKEDVARAGLLQQIARLCEDPVSPEELRRAQTFTLGANAIRRESAAAVLADLADAWLYGTSLDEIARYEDRIRAVTAEDVRRVARQYLRAECRVEGIIRGAGRVV